MATDYINIGKIVASFGLKGEVIVQHALGKKTAFKGGEALFIEEVKGFRLPYFITHSKAKDEQETYVKLEGIDSKEAARKLNRKPVWLTEESCRQLAGKSAPIAMIGFNLLHEGTLLGKVEEVIEQPHQVLLLIHYHGKEALIPLHAATLTRIDQQKKEIHVTLPDGLLDIYA